MVSPRAYALSVVAICSAAVVHGKQDGVVQMEKIVTATQATEAIPFMASIQDREFGKMCRGSVVGSYWILTAAHCVSQYAVNGSYNALEVWLGGVNFEENAPSTVINPVDVYIHEYYNIGGVGNMYDIALLKLAEPTDIEPVRLAFNSSFEEPGVTGFILDVTEVPIVSDEACIEAFHDSFDATSMVCAGYDEDGAKACEGDSGGPMYIQDLENQEYYQVGIVSFGLGCANEGFYGVYSSVNYFETWIRATMDGIYTPLHVNLNQQQTVHLSERRDANTEAENTSGSGDSWIFILLIVVGVILAVTIGAIFGCKAWKKYQRKRVLLGHTTAELPMSESTTELLY
eukprot:CFRG7705T1